MPSFYDPNRLLDFVIRQFHLKNDAALAAWLHVRPGAISKIRHRRLSIGAGMLLRMQEGSGLTITVLRGLMGDRRHYFRGKEMPLKTPNISLASLLQDPVDACKLVSTTT